MARPEIDKVIGILNWYQTIEADLTRLVGLVQENQDFFGNPPAGESCIKLAADKLESLATTQKRPKQS